MEKVETIDDAKAKEYIGEFKPEYSLLDIDKPITVGAIDLQDYYFEHKYAVVEAMKSAKKVIEEVGTDFGKKFGREYKLFEEYKLDDADIAIVAIGSTAGTTKNVVDSLREKGIKAGLPNRKTASSLPLLTRPVQILPSNRKEAALPGKSENACSCLQKLPYQPYR